MGLEVVTAPVSLDPGDWTISHVVYAAYTLQIVLSLNLSRILWMELKAYTLRKKVMKQIRHFLLALVSLLESFCIGILEGCHIIMSTSTAVLQL